MTTHIESTTQDHEQIRWSLQYFAVTNNFKSPGPAELILDRANNEFGFIYRLEPGIAVMAQFPDTDEPVHFAVSKLKAACLRSGASCKKICILMGHMQLDLMFTAATAAADFMQLLGRLVTKVGNLHFEIYEAPS